MDPGDHDRAGFTAPLLKCPNGQYNNIEEIKKMFPIPWNAFLDFGSVPTGGSMELTFRPDPSARTPVPARCSGELPAGLQPGFVLQHI